jgi:hypothetical protein
MLGNSFTAERANATFLVLDLTAQNNDNSASTLPLLHLVDTEGRINDNKSQRHEGTYREQVSCPALVLIPSRLAIG